MKISLIVLCFTVCLHSMSVVPCYAQSNTTDVRTGVLLKYGNIDGKIIDRNTLQTLPGVTVEAVGTPYIVVSDEKGTFQLTDLPIGNYTLSFFIQGYETVKKTDIIVRSGRNTILSIEMSVSLDITDEIVVNGGYFENPEDQPHSTTTFSGEEIRRAPGGEGDVSRIISILPSIAKVNDQVNSLIVRGGSPYENGFYIDNMEVPNINHYPNMGSTGGPISIINVDLIDDVTFAAGGFSAKYGDRLSAIMDLTFREGSRQNFELQCDLNMGGFGGLVEGPLNRGKGSWIFSARRSYLDLLVDAIGTGVAPRYSDYQGKFVYDINNQNKIDIIGIAADDHIHFDKETSEEEGNNGYGGTDTFIIFSGLNWQKLWSGVGYSQTSISYTRTHYDESYEEVITDRHLFNTNSKEQWIQLRNDNTFQPTKRHSFSFGFETKYIFNDYNYFVADYIDYFGNTIPERTVDRSIDGNKTGAFISHIWKSPFRFTTTIGCRLDHFSYTGNTNVSPRFSVSYDLTDSTSLSASTGIYYQSIPPAILSQNEEFKELRDPVAYHYVLGIKHLLTDDTQLTFEVYDKEYDHFPMDPSQPLLFPADEGSNNVEVLIDNGRAYSRGVEMVLQKKLVRGFYGLVSAAYFISQYRDYLGEWRSRLYDNRQLFNIEGGYKPNYKWEFSMRWVYAGGRPYTPFDMELSHQYNEGIYDDEKVNEDRFPAYHSLNLRADRRINFTNSNCIIFFDLWNVYNRKNIAGYYWNKNENERDRQDQWSFLPIVGLEWEF